MSFADDLRRALVTYRGHLLSSDGPAVDTARDVISNGRGGHGKHGITTSPNTFGHDLPTAVAMELSFARWCDVWERQGQPAQPTAARAKHGTARQAEDRAILDAVGMDPIDLGYVYRRSTEAICQLRRRRGLDPQTGERVSRPEPLTALARDQRAAHESAITTTTDEEE